MTTKYPVSRVSIKGPKRVGTSAVRVGEQWCTLWLVHESRYEKVVYAKAWNNDKPPRLEKVAVGRGLTVDKAVEQILEEGR